MTQAAVTQNLTQQWAAFASGISYDDLPAQAVPLLKGLVLDSFATTLAAGTLGDCCNDVARVVRAAGGSPEATVIGFGDRVPAAMAAFANGAMVHALNYDASGSEGGHLGVGAFSAPLAAAERTGGVSGKEYLVGVGVAAELVSRLAAALALAGVDANEKFLEGQLLGYFGAVVGAGRVLKLSPKQMHSALGLALMQAAGTRQVNFEGGPAKAVYGSFANHGGMLSALLAEQGIGAECDAFEGPAGLYGLHYDSRYERSVLHEGLGDRFHISSIKFCPWPTSGVIHPFIIAAMQFREDHGTAPEAIEHIHVRGNPHIRAWCEPLAERRRPSNAASAANSVFFATAKTLVNGNVTLNDFTPGGLAQPEALRISGTADYSMDEKLGNEFVLEVTTRDGQTLTSRVDLERDDPRRTLTYEKIVAKFHDCAQFAVKPIAASTQEELVEQIARLEELPDVSVLPALASGNRP